MFDSGADPNDHESGGFGGAGINILSAYFNIYAFYI